MPGYSVRLAMPIGLTARDHEESSGPEHECSDKDIINEDALSALQTLQVHICDICYVYG